VLELDDGSVFQAQVKDWVPLLEIPAFQAGEAVDVS